ncbi:MAG: penicillin-binding protein 1C [Synergistaceae bacterium]|jgi:penicillin-binding protein 1C|nr:penicillin-binding protein 1C [Synergistaceae bacterium]
MKANNAKKLLLSIAIIQIFSSSLFLFFIDRPSLFSSLDVRDYVCSQTVLDRDGNILNVSLSESDEWCIPVSPDQTGRWTKDVVVSLEDKRFFSHSGVDAIAIARAMISNVRAGRIVSGASTITAQLVRIAIPRKRTFYNKILEFWAAYRLEGQLSKEEILELYLNRAPFGGNIRGIEAACRIYFNKSARFLSLGESAALISLLSSPSRLRPDRFPEAAMQRRAKNLSLLLERKIITSEDYLLGMAEALPGKRFDMEKRAVMASAHVKTNGGRSVFLRSTLDSNLQAMLEKNISAVLDEYSQDITAAGIIVENAAGEVRAYVGNGRFGKGTPASEVDCGSALRSPGSLLKPFIYALAFERGILTPGSLLADTPIAFKGSAPRNFDLSYRGPVSARAALVNSLNTPAVRVLRMVGYSGAETLLKELGFEHIDREPRYYADSLVLGGCDVSMLEIAAAYRALAQGGKYMPLKWTQGVRSEKQALSPEVSFLVSNILQDTRRLVPIYREIFRTDNINAAFKTGTSYGYRDAWTAGYTGKYTIVTWVGSPEGKGNSSLVGIQAAAPLMLRIARTLGDDGGDFPIRPPRVYLRSVCSLSGDSPTANCPQTIFEYAIKGSTKITLCALHVKIDGKVVTAWPSTLQGWMHAREEVIPASKTVKIIRPLDGHTIILKKGEDEERVFFGAEGDTPLYWYLDGAFIGACERGEGIFANVKSGPHTAAVLSGNTSDTIHFEVRTPREIDEKLKTRIGNVIN